MADDPISPTLASGPSTSELTPSEKDLAAEIERERERERLEQLIQPSVAAKTPVPIPLADGLACEPIIKGDDYGILRASSGVSSTSELLLTTDPLVSFPQIQSEGQLSVAAATLVPIPPAHDAEAASLVPPLNPPVGSQSLGEDKHSPESIHRAPKRKRENEFLWITSDDEDSDEKRATTDVKDPNWEWPVYDEVRDRHGDIKFATRVKAPKLSRTGSPFQVIYLNAGAIALWPDAVQINLKSPHLIAILSHYFPDETRLQYPGKLRLDGRRVYLVLEKLKLRLSSENVLLSPQNKSSEIHSQNSFEAEAARVHEQHLVRFLEEEYATVAQRQKQLEKRVTFDMLWVFLTPGTTVVYYCMFTREQLCAKVLNNSYERSRSGTQFVVNLAVWDYKGMDYRESETERKIKQFSGEQPFDTVAVFPIDMHRTESNQALWKKFLRQGEKFHQLAMESSNLFMQYNGLAVCFKDKEVFKEKADGRVMIDHRNFAAMNPNYSTQDAEPPVSSSAGDQGRNNLKKSHNEVEEEKIIFAPGIVYGFSFTLKKWGAFSVSGFSDIEFDTNAFDAVVMTKERKRLLKSLVSGATQSSSSAGPSPSVEDLPRVDPIANKGKGCILLCYGGPGTGKTFSVKSLAETLNRPLWSLNVSEFGSTPGDVEKTLLDVLELAAKWKAVLVLDDADDYIEMRVASSNVNRKAMTGVFMKLLENYRGVLLLITNRITTFDEALCSRTNWSLHYPELDEKARGKIWKEALARVQAEEGKGVREEFVVEMARSKKNGWEINKAVETAHFLAMSKKENFNEEHLRHVVTLTSGEPPSMRNGVAATGDQPADV